MNPSKNKPSRKKELSVQPRVSRAAEQPDLAAHVAALQEQIATLNALVEQQKGNELQESGLPPSPPLMSPFGLPTAGYPASPAGTCSGFNSPLSAPATNSPVSGLKSQVSSSIPIYELKETSPAGYQSHGDSTSSSEESEDGFFTGLLDRARIQWLMGHWEALSKLELEQIEHHPDRAKLALLAAAGRLQTGQDAEAKAYIRLAQEWGVNKKLTRQVLIAGVHHNLAHVAALAEQRSRMLQHRNSAKKLGLSITDNNLNKKENYKSRILSSVEPLNSPAVLSLLPAYKLISRPEFFSLWRGSELSSLEWLCLKSFVDHGYQYRLYTYSKTLDVPNGIELADASHICKEETLNKFHYSAGSATGSKFAAGSDYFRYLGIRHTKKCWVDTDVICLSEDIKEYGSLMLAPECENFYNVAVFGVGSEEADFINFIIGECERFENPNSMPWGALSPKLVTRVLNEEFPHLRSKAKKKSLFYPLHWREISWVFLPSQTSEVLDRTKDSWFLHLWNEILSQKGHYKELMPPHGSYLRKKISEHGLDDLFIGKPTPETFKRVFR